MILSFKKIFPWGAPTRFEEKIREGTKIHTIREDATGRWEKGRKIHFANGVRTKNYNCFHEDQCSGVQYIKIYPEQKLILLKIPGMYKNIKTAWIGLLPAEAVALNDGFDSAGEFWQWFSKPFEGKIIHWTEFRY